MDDLLMHHDGQTVLGFLMQDAIDSFLPAPEDRRPRDLIQIHITHNQLRHGDINQLRRVENWNINAIINNLGAILQSNANWLLPEEGPNEGFNIDLMYIRRPEVGGMLPGEINMDTYLKKSKSFLQIKDSGSYCGPIAIAIALAHARKDNDEDSLKFYKKMVAMGNHKVRKNVAIQLLNCSNVSLETVQDLGAGRVYVGTHGEDRSICAIKTQRSFPPGGLQLCTTQRGHLQKKTRSQLQKCTLECVLVSQPLRCDYKTGFVLWGWIHLSRMQSTLQEKNNPQVYSQVSGL